jgi:hypothetical protein
MWDAVRVVTRSVGQLFEEIGRRVEGFHNRTRAARRGHKWVGVAHRAKKRSARTGGDVRSQALAYSCGTPASRMAS